MRTDFTFKDRVIDVTIDDAWLAKNKVRANAQAMSTIGVDLEQLMDDPLLRDAFKAEKDQAILNLAMADPEASGIQTDDAALNKQIEDLKAYVKDLKAFNAEKGSDLRVEFDAPGTFKIKVDNEFYKGGYSAKALEAEIAKLKEDYRHRPSVKVELFRYDPNDSAVKIGLDLGRYISKKMSRFLGFADIQTGDGVVKFAFYTPKREAPAKVADAEGDEDDCEW